MARGEVHKSKAERNKSLTERVYSMLHGENIKQCLQCGTCSATCPVSYAMDYTPRQIIAALRAGQLDKVLTSNTQWICASCYYCTVRCPANIKFTDLMYELKRLSIKYGMDRDDASILYQTFADTMNKYGRSAEAKLMLGYNIRVNPFRLLKMMPFGLKMFGKGRLPLRAEKIEGRQDIQKMLKYLKEKGEA
ncbi:MAG: 4Fe-4S dicluster domain-containing protein [Candidatus Poribacteria bacterium]